MASDQACPNLTNGSPASNLSPTSSAATQSADFAAPKLSGNTCMIEGCSGTLEDWYGKRSRTCQIHRKAEQVEFPDGPRRFCQKCSRFHPLVEFDGTKRNCRAQLLEHNSRQRRLRQMKRQKQHKEAAAAAAMATAVPGNGVWTRVVPQRPHMITSQPQHAAQPAAPLLEALAAAAAVPSPTPTPPVPDPAAAAAAITAAVAQLAAPQAWALKQQCGLDHLNLEELILLQQCLTALGSNGGDTTAAVAALLAAVSQNGMGVATSTQ